MINNSMDYKKHYNALIERSQNRILEGYVEKHHILPKCLGGGDEKTNIAILTPEEHFLAHQLLIKLYPGNRDLVYAVQLMTAHQTDARINNKLFGWLRKQMAIAMSAQTKKWLAENGHPRGMLNKKHTEEKKKQIGLSTKKAMIESVGVRIYAYNLDGSFFKEFRTISDCAGFLGTNPSNVKYTAEGKFGYCKGKQLRYEYTEHIAPYTKPTHPLKGRTRTAEHQKNLNAAIRNNKATCIYCGHESNKSAITRFHNNNCKERKV